jgi:hypothetical protein
MNIVIPAEYLQADLLPVNREEEIQQTLNASLVVGGVSFPSPFPAYFTMLDLADNAFFADPDHAEVTDFAVALWLLHGDRDQTLPAALEHVRGNKTALLDPAMNFYTDHYLAFSQHYRAFLSWIRITPWYGFSLIPSTGEASLRLVSPYLYDAPWMGSIIRSYASITGEPPDKILWETSVCRIGHVLAADAAAHGLKIRRPEDPESVKRKIKEAEAREKAGELHPWQREHPFDPIKGRISDTQIAARFEILAEMEEIKRKAKEGCDA